MLLGNHAINSDLFIKEDVFSLAYVHKEKGNTAGIEGGAEKMFMPILFHKNPDVP